MVKKSNINISAITVIRTIVFLLIGIIAFSAYTQTVEFLTTSSIFNVQEVLIDSSIQFIDVRALKQLKGSNIFQVDLKKLQRQIANQYPQISQLRVMRQLPHQIKVLAKKREAIAQVRLKNRFLIVDTEGVSLSYSPQPLALPVVSGVVLDKTRVVLGALVKNKELAIAVNILHEFKMRPRLIKLNVSSVDVFNLSKIDLSVSPLAHILLDQDQTVAKIDMLEMLLAQNRVDFNKVKYIDVRFKEPIIAENIDEEKIKP